ncbi:MAG: Ldh family oxidoreductase [Chloroflexi bacterium]|nr:Ldh family oxidoreductase [Chloroflexota bacterium]
MPGVPHVSHVPHERLRKAGRVIFEAAGTPSDIAATVADILVESNLVGHDSHGILRVPAYVAQIKAGGLIPDARPTLIEQTACTALMSGRRGFGHYAAHVATGIAVEKARREKVSLVGIVECNHIGRLGEYATQAARQGVLLMVTSAGTGSGGTTTPHGGAARALGTNPISFGIPAGPPNEIRSEPMIVDFATSVIAEGKIQVARSKGEKLPPGCILDKEGHPSVDPDDYYNGGMLLPFAGHKGYSLALVVNVLSAYLIGVDRFSSNGRGAGTLLLGIDAAAFRPAESYGASVGEFLDRIRSVPPAPGFDRVMTPGEPEAQTRIRRLAEGVPLPETIRERLVATAQDLGVSVESILGG